MTITSSKNLNNEQTQPGVFESYIMKLPEILIVALIAFFDLAAIPGLKQLDPLFYSCYVFFFVGIIMIFEYLKRRTLIIPGLIVMSLVLMLISRDMVLTVNILLALGITFFILFIALSRWQKIAFICFLIFVAANSVACAVTGIDNRFAVICLTVGVFYCVARCIRTDVDYRFAVTFALLFIAFLPIREEPIQWSLVKDVCYRVGSFVDGIGNEIGYRVSGIIDFGGSYSGYSSVGNLNGSIKKSSREEIAFDRAGGNDRTLYLKGADYSTITSKGLSGKESISSDYNDWFIVYMNALMDAEVSNREARCFARIESAEVLYEYLRTEDIIRPTNLINIDDEVENGLTHKAGKGFNYKLQYMDIDYASPYFQRVMEGYSGEITHSYDEMKEYVHDTFKINVSRFMSQEGYDAAVARMNSQEYMDGLNQYLDTSMSTDKIKNLSQELTANCETDYEKAKVIESYLRNYNYDTSVDLRDSDNFVESFLFDTKSGYCVHFASSMMLLLRDAGVPARYVNGYLYDGSADFVMSSDAHAWVEAYIEGMGWMPFEPTATKESAEDLSWGLVVKEIDEKEQTDWGEYYGEEMVEQMMNEGAEQYDKTSNESEETKEDNHKENREIIKRILIYAAIIVGAVIALLLVVFIGKRIWFTFLPEERKLGEMVKKEKKTIEKNVAEDIIEKLHKNSSSIYDYLNYVETDEERVRLKELFDRYYFVRFRKTGE
ncbi:MAG: hypothetical protein K6E27_10955 [Eubacterium sp.]|nr:hypothetical protein [Eubacterium sp.]